MVKRLSIQRQRPVRSGVDRKTKSLRPQQLTGERYEGWRNHDTWNFNLMVDNDERLYRNKEAWRKNFQRKQKRGVFDRAKAKFALRQYMGKQVRDYEIKELHAEPEDRVNLNNVDWDETLNHFLEE